MNSSPSIVSVTSSPVVALFLLASQPSGRSRVVLPSDRVIFLMADILLLLDDSEMTVTLGAVVSAMTAVASVTGVLASPMLPTKSLNCIVNDTFPSLSSW